MEWSELTEDSKFWWGLIDQVCQEAGPRNTPSDRRVVEFMLSIWSQICHDQDKYPTAKQQFWIKHYHAEYVEQQPAGMWQLHPDLPVEMVRTCRS